MSRSGQHFAMLSCNVTLASNVTSGDVIYLLAALAARCSVIKRGKRVAGSFISVFSQGIAKLTKGTPTEMFSHVKRSENWFVSM